MKSLIKTILFNSLAIFAVAYVASGVTYNSIWPTLIIAAAVLALMNAFVKPVLKIILLPINLITLGLLGWLVHVFVLYGVTVLVDGFEVSAFTLNLFGTGIALNTFFAYVVVAFLLNIATTIISAILD